MPRHQLANIATTQPSDNLSAVKQVVFSVDIALAIIALFIIVIYIWIDYKDNKEIDELLKKNGIDTKKIRT